MALLAAGHRCRPLSAAPHLTPLRAARGRIRRPGMPRLRPGWNCAAPGQRPAGDWRCGQLRRTGVPPTGTVAILPCSSSSLSVWRDSSKNTHPRHHRLLGGLGAAHLDRPARHKQRLAQLLVPHQTRTGRPRTNHHVAGALAVMEGLAKAGEQTPSGGWSGCGPSSGLRWGCRRLFHEPVGSQRRPMPSAGHPRASGTMDRRMPHVADEGCSLQVIRTAIDTLFRTTAITRRAAHPSRQRSVAHRMQARTRRAPQAPRSPAAPQAHGGRAPPAAVPRRASAVAAKSRPRR